MIVFFRVSKLIKQLQENNVPESHKFFYFTALVVLLSLLNPLKYDFVDLLGMEFFSAKFEMTFYMIITNLIINLLGTYFVWKTNFHGDGANFLERYIFLSLPLIMWLLPITVILAILDLSVALFFNFPDAFTDNLSDHLIVFISVFQYILLNNWIRKVSHHRAESTWNGTKRDPYLKPLLIMTVVSLLLIGIPVAIKAQYQMAKSNTIQKETGNTPAD